MSVTINGTPVYISHQGELNLANKNLTSIPEKIGNLVNILKMNLSGNKLTSIPKEIGNLINLTDLYLSANKLRSIPKEIGNLGNLEHLHLDGNKLTSIPEEIGNLGNLAHLNLTINKLTSIPEEIGNLGNLAHLYLDGNELASIPEEIGNLINLMDMNLSGNKLSILPEEIGNLMGLTKFDLKQNELTSIPEEIGNLINLESLNLKDNKLTSIPEEIGNLINLTMLNLEENKLTCIPKEIGNLVRLERLYLGNNELTSIPEEMGNLVRLGRFILNNNKLISLPKEINNMRKLKEIDLKYNNITILPKLRADIRINALGNPLYGAKSISLLQKVMNKFKDQTLIPTSRLLRQSMTEWMKYCNTIKDVNMPELKRLLMEYGDGINININNATKAQLCDFLKNRGFEKECEMIEDESNIGILKDALMEQNITEIRVNIGLLTKRQICKFLAEDYLQVNESQECKNDYDLIGNDFDSLSRQNYMIDSNGYCFTRDDFMGMKIKDIRDLDRYKHPFTNVIFSKAFNEDDKKRMMRLIGLHYGPDVEVRDETNVRSRRDMLRMASEAFGLLASPYFPYSSFMELSIPRLIGVSNELNRISDRILVSRDVIERFRYSDRIESLTLLVNTLDRICRETPFDREIVIHNLSEAMRNVIGER